jgi:hypothetical protein
LARVYPPSTAGEWTSPPLTSDTVFTAEVQVSATGGVPLTGTLTTVVSVQNPTLVAAGITAGQATVSGAMSVAGAMTANAVTATGAAINGNLSAASASLSGPLSVTGAVSMLGTGTMLAQGTNIAQAGVFAQTDGFAVAQVLTPGDGGKSSFAYGLLYTVGTWFQVQGGTVGSFGSGWSDVMNNNPNAICVPIPANTLWQYLASNGGGNQWDSPIQIWWFPMGGNTPG